MPETPLGSLARDLRQSATELVWDQWGALGASVVTTETAQAIVDPEALILMSLSLQGQERRLTDVLESWITVNSGLISVQRIKNLRARFPATDQAALAWIAEVAEEKGKDSRWGSLASTSHEREFQPRGNRLRAIQTRFQTAATLMLQLRRGMGVGAKADILTCLIGIGRTNQPSEWVSAATLADATGYTSAAVRRAADDLAAARFIHSKESVATRVYGVRPSPWKSLLQIGDMRFKWRWWADCMGFVANVLAQEEILRNRNVSQYAYETFARELIEGHSETFARNKIVERPDFGQVKDWPALLESSVGALRQWMKSSV